jgi:drug/metabolite transporter (DMT)-like permease
VVTSAAASSLRAGGRLLPTSLLVAYGVLGGGTFTVSKIAMQAGVTPVSYTLWQCVGTFAVILAVSLVRGLAIPLSAGYLRFSLVCGTIGLILPCLAMFTAVTRLPAGVLAIIVATVALFTYAVAYGLRLERLVWSRAAGLLLGLAGALLILLPRASLPAPDLAPWVLLGFAAPLLYALASTYVDRRRPPECSGSALTVGMLGAAVVVLIPAALASGAVFVPRLPPGPAEWAIAGQIAISSIGYLLFFEIIRLAGAVFFSQVGYLVTISGVAWAALALGETYSGWVWLAAALILAGLVLVNHRPAARARPRPAPARA